MAPQAEKKARTAGAESNGKGGLLAPCSVTFLLKPLLALFTPSAYGRGFGGRHYVYFVRVKNQDDRTVAHDGCARNTLEVAKVCAKGFDNDFLPLQKPINHEAQTAVVVVDDNHGKHIRQRIGAGQAQHF